MEFSLFLDFNRKSHAFLRKKKQGLDTITLQVNTIHSEKIEVQEKLKIPKG